MIVEDFKFIKDELALVLEKLEDYTSAHEKGDKRIEEIKQSIIDAWNVAEDNCE